MYHLGVGITPEMSKVIFKKQTFTNPNLLFDTNRISANLFLLAGESPQEHCE